MRNESTLRNNDEKKSDIVSKFIEENFYKLKTKNFSRITNKEQQIQGIDVIFDFNDENYVCDEKSAVSYINKPLFTFAFAIIFTFLFKSFKVTTYLFKEIIFSTFFISF